VLAENDRRDAEDTSGPQSRREDGELAERKMFQRPGVEQDKSRADCGEHKGGRVPSVQGEHRGREDEHYGPGDSEEPQGDGRRVVRAGTPQITVRTLAESSCPGRRPKTAAGDEGSHARRSPARRNGILWCSIEYGRQPDRDIGFLITSLRLKNPLSKPSPVNFTTAQILTILIIIGALASMSVLRAGSLGVEPQATTPLFDLREIRKSRAGDRRNRARGERQEASYRPAGISASFTFADTGLPSRMTVTSTVSPTLVRSTKETVSSASVAIF